MQEISERAMVVHNAFRENRTIAFYIILRDMRSAQKRKIDELLGQIIKKINRHSRSPCNFDTNIYMLQGNNSGDYAVYLQCPDPKAVGFNRQYFSKKGTYGSTLLNLAQLHLVEQVCGPPARAKFDKE